MYKVRKIYLFKNTFRKIKKRWTTYIGPMTKNDEFSEKLIYVKDKKAYSTTTFTWKYQSNKYMNLLSKWINPSLHGRNTKYKYIMKKNEKHIIKIKKPSTDVTFNMYIYINNCTSNFYLWCAHNFFICKPYLIYFFSM